MRCTPPAHLRPSQLAPPGPAPTFPGRTTRRTAPAIRCGRSRASCKRANSCPESEVEQARGTSIPADRSWIAGIRQKPTQPQSAIHACSLHSGQLAGAGCGPGSWQGAPVAGRRCGCICSVMHRLRPNPVPCKQCAQMHPHAHMHTARHTALCGIAASARITYSGAEEMSLGARCACRRKPCAAGPMAGGSRRRGAAAARNRAWAAGMPGFRASTLAPGLTTCQRNMRRSELCTPMHA